MDRNETGKLTVSIAKSLKGYQIADPRIASFLYATLEAGRLGLFVSAMKSEKRAKLKRLQLLAAQEGITLPVLTGQLLPWLENAGLCHLTRDLAGNILDCTSLVLAYRDLLNAVSDFYESRQPADEDRACLMVLRQASELPRSESVLRQEVATTFSEATAHTALTLAKAYNIVASSGNSADPLLYAPRVWTGLLDKAPQALTPLDDTQREVLTYLINMVRASQGYPETLIRKEAIRHGFGNLIDMAIGIALMNRTELQLADGSRRSFLTTPHFYDDLRGEFGEDMCDRVKIFLDSIRNGQYFGSRATGRILDPERLLRVLLDRGQIGPATAIGQDYIVAEKAGIVRVQRASFGNTAFMELGQEDTVRKVLEIVSSGAVDPSTYRMAVSHISDGTLFKSIEHGRAELGGSSTELAELEHEIINRLREG